MKFYVKTSNQNKMLLIKLIKNNLVKIIKQLIKLNKKIKYRKKLKNKIINAIIKVKVLILYIVNKIINNLKIRNYCWKYHNKMLRKNINKIFN